MNGNRSGVLLAALVLVGGVLTVSWRGIPAAAESPAAAQAPAVHSVKVSLAPSKPGEEDCEVITLTPEIVGVYPKDTLIFNVENGCSTDAMISIEQFTVISPPGSTVRLSDEELKLPKELTVAAGDRQRFDVTIGGGGDDLKEEHRFDYAVTVTSKSPGGTTGKPKKLPGGIHMCRRPPCPTG